MREHIRKSHNVTMLLYHLVMPVKYRREIFTTKRIEEGLINSCHEISQNYEIYFVSISVDGDHVHLLIQSVPTLSITGIVRTVKSFTAKHLLSYKEELKGKLRGCEIRTGGFYANSVGVYAGYQTIHNYVVNQGNIRRGFQQIYGSDLRQLLLFG